MDLEIKVLDSEIATIISCHDSFSPSFYTLKTSLQNRDNYHIHHVT